jgi:hypothetical protein
VDISFNHFSSALEFSIVKNPTITLHTGFRDINFIIYKVKYKTKNYVKTKNKSVLKTATNVILQDAQYAPQIMF